MKFSTTLGIAAGLAIALQSLANAAADAPPAAKGEAPATVTACAPAVPFPNGIETLDAIRVYKAANGESAFETVKFKGESKAYFKPGEMFSQNKFANAAKVQIVSGPPNVVLPAHAPMGKEIFLTIQGSSTVVLPNGQERAVVPGTVVIFEDGGSKSGHSGRTGPCGYVAINVAFPDSANNP